MIERVAIEEKINLLYGDKWIEVISSEKTSQLDFFLKELREDYKGREFRMVKTITKIVKKMED